MELNYAFDEAEEADEFMASKPWKGAIKAPSTEFPPETLKRLKRRPDVDAQIDWVYGVQTTLSRNSIRYNFEEDILYTAAACGLKYDPDDHRQWQVTGHSDDIMSLAVRVSKHANINVLCRVVLMFAFLF